MTWVTWRQHRGQVLVALLLAVGLAPVLALGSRNLLAAYRSGNPYGAVLIQAGLYGPLFSFLRALPLLLGIFVGVPLVGGEIERGTHRLAWTQSITRKRWLAVRLAWVGGLSLLAFALLAAILTVWSRPIWLAVGPWLTFDVTGIVVIAYAAFALALGVALGAIIGKVLPAMAASIPIFWLARTATTALRPYYLPPLQDTWNPAGPNPHLKDLVIRHGATVVPDLHGPGYQMFQIFQPATRFWTFQGIEAALFLVLAAALVLLTFWWVAHRVH